MAQFREEEHPRDNDGKFKEKGASDRVNELVDKYSDTPDEDKVVISAPKNSFNKDKAIKSYKKQIDKHSDKIKNPQNYIPDWEHKSEQYKNGVINYWEKEIKNFKNQIKEIEKEYGQNKYN